MTNANDHHDGYELARKAMLAISRALCHFASPN
jgi:hypothetical protein